VIQSSGGDADEFAEQIGESSPEASERAQPIFDELRQAMEGQQFASLEEAQALLGGFTSRRNQMPIDDFLGLSADQMRAALNHPFESPQLATFPAVLQTTPSSPIAILFDYLINVLGEKGLRPTAKGNLPVKLVREAALLCWGEERYARETRYGDIRTEPHFHQLHVTRLTARIAGLIWKTNGKYIPTRACRTLMDKHGLAGAYPALFRTYVEKFNWGYSDFYPELWIVQRSFLFTLYLIHRFGDVWRENAFYAEAFARAFPAALDEIEPEPYSTPEHTLQHCYSLRCLERFAILFGLIETEPISDPDAYSRFLLRKSPLFDEVVQFHI